MNDGLRLWRCPSYQCWRAYAEYHNECACGEGPLEPIWGPKSHEERFEVQDMTLSFSPCLVGYEDGKVSYEAGILKRLEVEVDDLPEEIAQPLKDFVHKAAVAQGWADKVGRRRRVL